LKAHVKLQGGALVIEVEAAGQKELFEAIADAQEVFGADRVCGFCGAPAKFTVRRPGKHKYFQMVCTEASCRGELNFGQVQDRDALWPKRVDETGKPLPYSGWSKFHKEGDK
jgi:hypothetical protein